MLNFDHLGAIYRGEFEPFDGVFAHCISSAILRFRPQSCPHNLFARLWTIREKMAQVAETIEFVQCAMGVCI